MLTCKLCQQSYPVYNHHKGLFCTRAGRTCQEDICEGCELRGGESEV